MRMRAMLRWAVMTLVVVSLAACSPPPLAVEGSGKNGIEITPLKTYGTLQSKFLIWLAGVEGIPVANGVDCYRIVYPSTDENGRPLRLSGLLALPHDANAVGLVSFQHGTTSDRERVPSNLSTDGLAAALLFAGNGYAMIAPDYVGLGVSKRPHPYYVAADTARAVADMIHAVRHIKGVPATAPFLMGFSEGAYASLATQRALEAEGEPVLATAAIAGAYNLRTISIPWTLEGRSPQASIYLALWVRGYAARYTHPLESAFAPPYAARVPELLDTPRDPADVMKALPRDPHALFRADLLDAIAGHGKHWVVDALAENEMGDWTSKAPIRLYYGSKDVDVPPSESLTTAKTMRGRGADVTAINVGAKDHDGSVLAAAPLIFQWLRELSAAYAKQN